MENTSLTFKPMTNRYCWAATKRHILPSPLLLLRWLIAHHVLQNNCFTLCWRHPNCLHYKTILIISFSTSFTLDRHSHPCFQSLYLPNKRGRKQGQQAWSPKLVKSSLRIKISTINASNPLCHSFLCTLCLLFIGSCHVIRQLSILYRQSESQN